MAKLKVNRANRINGKLKPLIIAAIVSGNDNRLTVLIARSNLVLSIQRNTNLANGMQGEAFKPITIEQAKAIARAKGVL
jgi:hypothetical protein